MPKGLREGLGFEEAIVGSEAGLTTANVLFTGSVTSFAEFSGLNAFLAGSVQCDKIMGDVQVTGLNVFAAGSMQADKIIGDVQLSGLDVFAAGSVQADVIVGDVRISGLDVFAVGSVQADKIVGDVQLSGLDVFAAGSVQADVIVGDVVISGVNVYAAGSTLAAGRRLSSAGTGSPVVWGRLVQAGNGTTSAGSILWVAFPVAFSAAPFVALTIANDDDGDVGTLLGSSLVAGSVRVVSGGASKNFNWIAVGPA